MGSGNQGHVRYLLYNESKNETERGKISWETPHPSKYNASKKEEGRKEVVKQLCPSL
jgi:hypothetical protein